MFAREAVGVSWNIKSHEEVKFASDSDFNRKTSNLRREVTMGMSVRQEKPDFHLSFNVGANPASVVANRREAFGAMSQSIECAVFAEQVHGSEVALVTETDFAKGAVDPLSAIPSVDALITNHLKVVLCINVADCLPIFIYDPIHCAIGLVHSGWRGTAGNIVGNTFKRMSEVFRTNPQKCYVSIGPGISGAGYEVDQKVFDAFREDQHKHVGFTCTRLGHWNLDLTKTVVSQLRELGVQEKNLSCSQWRTDTDSRTLQSHRLENNCPRMLCMMKMALP